MLSQLDLKGPGVGPTEEAVLEANPGELSGKGLSPSSDAKRLSCSRNQELPVCQELEKCQLPKCETGNAEVAVWKQTLGDPRPVTFPLTSTERSTASLRK